MKENKKVTKFVAVGIGVTLFDFAIYTLLTTTIWRETGQLWLATMISGLAATVLAFYLHSRITWREREVENRAIWLFLAWNAMMIFAVRPVLVGTFGLLGGFYSWCFGVSSWMGLPFTLDFITKTGVFGFATLVVMVINFLGYEKFVFNDRTKVGQKSQR